MKKHGSRSPLHIHIFYLCMQLLSLTLFGAEHQKNALAQQPSKFIAFEQSAGTAMNANSHIRAEEHKTRQTDQHTVLAMLRNQTETEVELPNIPKSPTPPLTEEADRGTTTRAPHRPSNTSLSTLSAPAQFHVHELAETIIDAQRLRSATTDQQYDAYVNAHEHERMQQPVHRPSLAGAIAIMCALGAIVLGPIIILIIKKTTP